MKLNTTIKRSLSNIRKINLDNLIQYKIQTIHKEFKNLLKDNQISIDKDNLHDLYIGNWRLSQYAVKLIEDIQQKPMLLYIGGLNEFGLFDNLIKQKWYKDILPDITNHDKIIFDHLLYQSSMMSFKEKYQIDIRIYINLNIIQNKNKSNLYHLNLIGIDTNIEQLNICIREQYYKDIKTLFGISMALNAVDDLFIP